MRQLSVFEVPCTALHVFLPLIDACHPLCISGPDSFNAWSIQLDAMRNLLWLTVRPSSVPHGFSSPVTFAEDVAHGWRRLEECADSSASLDIQALGCSEKENTTMDSLGYEGWSQVRCQLRWAGRSLNRRTLCRPFHGAQPAVSTASPPSIPSGAALLPHSSTRAEPSGAPQGGCWSVVVAGYVATRTSFPISSLRDTHPRTTARLEPDVKATVWPLF